MRLTLTREERESHLWLKINKALEIRLAELRFMNDSPKPEADTALLRGAIKEVREFMAMGNPPIAERM